MIATIEVPEFGDKLHYGDALRYPGVVSEEIERNEVVNLARKIVDLPVDPTLDSVRELLFTIDRYADDTTAALNPDVDDFHGEQPTRDAGSSMYRMSLRRFEQNAVSETVAELLRREPELAEGVGELHEIFASESTVHALCAAMTRARIAPTSVTRECLARIERILTVDGSGSRADSSLGDYARLVGAIAELDSSQLVSLFHLAKFATFGVTIGFDWINLTDCLKAIARRAPKLIHGAVNSIFQEQSADTKIIIMSLQVASSITKEFPLPLDTVTPLIDSRDAQVQRAAVEYAGALGTAAEPLIERLMVLGDDDSRTGSLALRAVAQIGLPREKVSAHLISQWKASRS